MAKLRILVCGDRNWVNRNAILSTLKNLPEGTTIIHGDCRGADRIAGDVAAELGFNIKAFPADWARYGRAAGPIRNRQMLDEGVPDYLLVFHDALEVSKGTKNMIHQAKQRGLLYFVYNEEA